MPMKFMGKNIRKRVIRPMKNSAKFGQLNKPANPPKKEERVEKEVDANVEDTKTKNNKTKKQKNMDVDKLNQIEEIAGVKVPQRKVKIEKAEKGLYERTENSTILLTEDNKMLLND